MELPPMNWIEESVRSVLSMPAKLVVKDPGPCSLRAAPKAVPETVIMLWAGSMLKVTGAADPGLDCNTAQASEPIVKLEKRQRLCMATTVARLAVR